MKIEISDIEIKCQKLKNVEKMSNKLRNFNLQLRSELNICENELKIEKLKKTILEQKNNTLSKQY